MGIVQENVKCARSLNINSATYHVIVISLHWGDNMATKYQNFATVVAINKLVFPGLKRYIAISDDTSGWRSSLKSDGGVAIEGD